MSNIQFASENDLVQILKIYNDSIKYTTSVYSYDPRTASWIQEWFDIKNRENYPVLVWKEEQQIMGFASYGQFRNWPAYQYCVEHSIHVNSSNRGKGIGKSLLIELIKIAKSRGLKTMIGGIDAENLKSLDFHKKMGFEEVGHLKNVGFKFDRWLDLKFVQIQL